jgi:[ribosomal protein S5]-alanine N-acetyltransferase
MPVYFHPRSSEVMETERFVLEPIRVNHAAKLFDSFQNDQLCFIGRPKSVAGLEDRYRKFETHGPNDGKQVWLNWAAKIRESETYIGWFQASIYDDQTTGLSYVVFPSFWRNGFAVECCRHMIDHLIAVYSPVLFFAEMNVKNLASIALAEKLGFTRTDQLPSPDEYRYELVANDWRQERANQRRNEDGNSPIGSPGTDPVGQPRVPHHRSCGSATGGSNQIRAFAP